MNQIKRKRGLFLFHDSTLTISTKAPHKSIKQALVGQGEDRTHLHHTYFDISPLPKNFFSNAQHPKERDF